MARREARRGGGGGGRGGGRGGGARKTPSTLSFAMISTAWFFLAGLGTRVPLSLSGWHRRTSDGAQAFSGFASASVAATMAAEVQSNGEIAEIPVDAEGEVGGGGGAGVDLGGTGEGGREGEGAGAGQAKARRVSSDVRVRYPVTTVEKQPARMVVIGDIHGDLGAFAETLRAAGLVDDAGDWAGGETVLVQAGDVFDRGDSDLEVEEWLWTLQEQAEASGGAVYHLLGNHEIMNAMGDHSTASQESFKPFLELDVNLEAFGDQLDKFPDWVKSRLAAMAPTGPVARMLASHSVVMKIGDSLFVHGGLKPVNLDPRYCRGAAGLACLENINRWTHDWLMGKGEMPQQELWVRESPVWSRYYSSPGGIELSSEALSDLQQVLDATGTVRMIVGHTPQEAGINSAAGGKLWRTDTGMTAMIGGQPEALEIVDGVATIISAKGRIPGEDRACSAGKALPHLPAVPARVRNARGGRTAVAAAA